MIIRGQSGLGDHIYCHGIAREYLRQGKDVQIVSKYDEVFKYLDVELLPWDRRKSHWITLSYGNRKEQNTNQWQDCLITGRLNQNIELIFEWKYNDIDFIKRIKNKIKWEKSCLVVYPYQNFASRTDGFGKELNVNVDFFKNMVDVLKDKYYTIGIKTETSYGDIDVDYEIETTINQYFDLNLLCDMVISPVGNVIPIREGLNKPAIIVYSNIGMKSKIPYINRIIPEKVHSKLNLMHGIIDNENIKDFYDKFKF